jgi:DNA-binding MarR family transcriptional regulator
VPSEETGISDQVLAALRHISREMDKRSRALMKEYGLSMPQLMVINAVGKTDGMSVGHIAQAVSLSQATITSIVDRLEARNLVVRQRGTADKRQVFVRVTDAGRSIADAHPSIFQEQFTRRLDQLEEWEQTQLLSSLQRVAWMMDTDTARPTSSS